MYITGKFIRGFMNVFIWGALDIKRIWLRYSSDFTPGVSHNDVCRVPAVNRDQAIKNHHDGSSMFTDYTKGT